MIQMRLFKLKRVEYYLEKCSWGRSDRRLRQVPLQVTGIFIKGIINK